MDKLSAEIDAKISELKSVTKKRSRIKRKRFRWQHCTECGYEGVGLAVLHLQNCFPCSICQHSTVHKYGSPIKDTV